MVGFLPHDGKQHTLTGHFQLHTAFRSKFLKNERDILVYLPPGYEEDHRRRYAVLYLHDGQNVFDSATSYCGDEWQVDEAAEHLIAARVIKPLIIVGVYNTGEERIHEYTPTCCPQRQAGGKADLYGRLLVEELKPFMDAGYRTLRDARHTGLGGSSLGGLATLYLGLQYPEVFGRLAVMSPSIWWDCRTILSYVEQRKRKTGQRIWLDMGTEEGKHEWTVANTRELRDILIRKGYRLEKDLAYLEASGAGHNERAWAARVSPMLQFLFPAHGR